MVVLVKVESVANSENTGLVCFIFLICSLRTNIVFFIIFLSLILGFSCLAGAYWNLALAYENPLNTSAASKAGKLVIVSFLSRYSLLPSLLPSPPLL